MSCYSLSTGRPEFATLYLGPLIEECRLMYPTMLAFDAARPRIKERILPFIHPVFKEVFDKFEYARKNVFKKGRSLTLPDKLLQSRFINAKKYRNAVMNYIRMYLFDPMAHSVLYSGPAFAGDEE